MSTDAPTIRDVVTSDLPSQVEETVSACPEFRILLVGNSGVGKSSLVASIFNISLTDIDIADGRAGRADITHEYRSNENPRFILHDSQGFEPGSTGNLAKVEDFLRDRSAKAIKDRVHAIWLCALAPRKGSRLQQTGDEEIVTLARKFHIPVIVVFTKYDMLVNEQYRKAADDGVQLSEDEAERKADASFHDRIEELEAGEVSIVKVSTHSRYPRRLATQEELTDVTRKCLGDTANVALKNPTSNEKRIQLAEEQMNDEVTVAWTLAQRMSATQKVEVSISEGFKKYWGNLGKSAFFEGHTMTQCVFRIHDDILKVWNFNDPHKLLSGMDFFTQMNKLVSLIVTGDKVEEVPAEGVPPNDTTGSLFRSALSGAGPAVATSPHILLAVGIAARIAGIGYVVFKFLYGKYQKLPSAAKYLGAYIVDLTCVLHRIFVATLHTEPPAPLSKELISSVVEKYKEEDLWRVHRLVSDMSFIQDYKGKIEDLIYETLSLPRATYTPQDDAYDVSVPSSSRNDTPTPLDTGHYPSPGSFSDHKGRKKSERRPGEQKDKACIIA